MTVRSSIDQKKGRSFIAIGKKISIQNASRSYFSAHNAQTCKTFMKIGFVSRWNPRDRRSWSGICFHTFQEIGKYNQMEIFSYYRSPWYLREWVKMLIRINKRVFRKNTAAEFLTFYAKYYSKQLEKSLASKPVDLLFVSASPQLIAYIKTSIPIIFNIDATFKQIQGYYPYFSNLAKFNIRQGIALDKRAFQHSRHLILASDWNKNSAVNDYGIEESKISVVAFGANMDSIPESHELTPYIASEFKILFLGVEWIRKGGDIVLEAFRILRQRGVNAHLHIIGCVPPHDLSGEQDITVIPFLNKNVAEDLKRLHKIFLESAVLFLPTRAECSAIVFSEAGAFGLAALTTDTGGVTTYVKNDINGYALPFEAGGEQYADVLAKLAEDRELLAKLKIGSRRYYEEKLNWGHWGKRFQELAEKIV